MTASRTSLPGTTWFLRDQNELDVLVAALSRDSARSRSLYIWSIGCSTGQEPYGLTMALLDAGLKPQILATDIRQEALDAAVSARYPMRSVAVLPSLWLQRYTTAVSAEEVAIHPSVTSRVRFQLHDVAQLPDLPRGWTTFDAVLCRNVLIYFDRTEAVDVVRRIGDVCRPGGYLLLSAAERPLAWPCASWMQDADFPDSALLRRVQAAPTDSARRRTLLSGAPGVPASAPVTRAAQVDPGACANTMARAAGLLYRGDPANAVALLDDVLAQDRLHATAHLLRGMALKQLGQVPEATAALRTARLLFHDAAWMPPYQLGLLLEQLGDPTAAAEAYRHTLAAIHAGARSGMPDVEHEDALRTTVVDTCQLRLRVLMGVGRA